MTTVTQFTPTEGAPFTFQATLTGPTTNVSSTSTTFTVTVLWNTFGQRGYIQITDQNGEVVLFRPLVASAASTQVSYTIITTTNGMTISTSYGTLSMDAGAGGEILLNGTVMAGSGGSSAATYVNGVIYGQDGTSLNWYAWDGTSWNLYGPDLPYSGTPGYDINLIGGYFTGSTMVFTEDLQQFVVTP